jgi:hypothetical protein
MAADHIVELNGRKKNDGERGQIGDEDRDATDAGDTSGVEFSDVVGMIHKSPAYREIPAQRRENERHAEGRKGKYE